MSFPPYLRALLIALLISLAGQLCVADGAIWPLYDLHRLDLSDLQKNGLQLSADDIYAGDGTGVASAIIKLGGGTAGFVSPEGLIVTNHHVAYGALQRSSTVERNYVRDGFYAATREEEIPAIGTNAYVTLSVEDVSERVLANVAESMTDLERRKSIEQAQKEIIQETETSQDISCRIAEMFPGRQYVMYTQLKIRDIRIVFAPPSSVGNFGGEVDNWMWPRHTGDFSFVRAYVAADGSTKEYSPDNVPYKPIRYLPISARGVQKGDLTLMIGYPGRSARYASSYELRETFEYEYPQFIKDAGDYLAILEAASAADSAVAVRLLGTMRGYANYFKKTKGLLYGARRIDLVQQRQERETKLTEFLASRNNLAEYRLVLPTLDSLYTAKEAHRRHDHVLGNLLRGPDYLKLATELYWWATEFGKPDLEREQGYQDRYRADKIEQMKEAQINLVPSVDRQIMTYWLRQAQDLPEDQRIAAIDSLLYSGLAKATDEEIAFVVDSLYDNTIIGSLHARLAIFDMTAEEIRALPDPMIQLAIALYPARNARFDREKAFDGAVARLDPWLQAAYAEMQAEAFYPDANSTRRFNYGFVEEYSPQDAVTFDYMTTLEGVMEKETGIEPFIVPSELKAAYAAKDFGPYVDSASGSLPVNFLSTNFSTNGHSGSPILNGSGDLIGVVFDGAWWGVVADYQYSPELCRAIHLDSRYMLFLIDNVYHLDELLAELTIK